MNDNNKNLVVAVILSVLILGAYQYFYVRPQQERYRQQQAQAEIVAQQVKPAPPPGTEPIRDRASLIAENARIPVTTPELRGSINLKGARLDDLSLVNYRTAVDPAAPQITLLSPAGSAPPSAAYFAEFGWLSADSAAKVPTADTEWQADGKQLSPDQPLKLHWDNGQGLLFERMIAVDDQFMFTVTDTVHNNTVAVAVLYPTGSVLRQAVAPTSTYIHEGPLGVVDGTLETYTGKDLAGAPRKSEDSTGGWLGVTDKYWLTALVPPQDEKISIEFAYVNGATPAAAGLFQTDFRGAPMTVAAGATAQHAVHFFAGAKRLRLLDHYEAQYGIPHFDRAIDFGRFYWLAEPFLYVLDYLALWLGNFGLAILACTVLLKIVTLPLSIKSFRAMAKMKTIQPEMKRIQERFADDKMRQGAEMMELYKREKINPTSGCVPMLIQIPIFFALYKVLYVGIEMRQVPFYGWIKDLSMPDPTNVATLFGLVPWQAPAMITIGAWPLLMGVSMFLQQKLSPQPPDKTQARMFMFLPLVFTFTMAQMPAGLVIYWSWSNLLSIAQQWFVMHQSKPKQK